MTHSIQCLVDKEIITEEQGNEISKIITALPESQTELLKILVAFSILGYQPE